MLVQVSSIVSTRGTPGAAAPSRVEEEPGAEPSTSYSNHKMEARLVLLLLTLNLATHRLVP